jgi:hypothetical protein
MISREEGGAFMEDLLRDIRTLISGELSTSPDLGVLDCHFPERNRRPVGDYSGALMRATSKSWC